MSKYAHRDYFQQKAKIEVLKTEVKKWKLEVCKWQDIDTENQEKIEKLEARIVLLEKQKENLKIDFRERLSTVVNIVDENLSNK